jgi:hypothetical protein
MNTTAISHIEKMFVTNDAATILNKLEVRNPAAKTIIESMKEQSDTFGAHAKTVLIVAISLLEQAVVFIKNVTFEIANFAHSLDFRATNLLKLLRATRTCSSRLPKFCRIWLQTLSTN